ncbi:hypothetical protein B0H17DRAFT_1216660 [Mycena rosella]|uniref:Uncharacterized protein n=1 Tax=Mycena rosella TaxID=1033263 RepID=A0AAD7C6J8_MYCRO|nr:hypothetical protein B0H17DRAFT_1216660 [Mycena rosella]
MRPRSDAPWLKFVNDLLVNTAVGGFFVLRIGLVNGLVVCAVLRQYAVPAGVAPHTPDVDPHGLFMGPWARVQRMAA